jgi:hypothetical protein
MDSSRQRQAAGARRRPASGSIVIPLVLVLAPLVRLGAEDLLDLDTPTLTSLEVTSDPGRASQAIPWGDISTAYRSTGIPDIVVYMAASPRMLSSMRL